MHGVAQRMHQLPDYTGVKLVIHLLVPGWMITLEF